MEKSKHCNIVGGGSSWKKANTVTLLGGGLMEKSKHCNIVGGGVYGKKQTL